MFRLLIFSPGFVPDLASENLVSAKLALAMLDRGWDVTTISARDEGFSYGTQWSEPWLALEEHTHRITYGPGTRAGRFAQRIRESISMRHPIAKVRWAYRACKHAMELHRQAPFDAVLTRSISGVAHLPAIRFVKETGVPWLANWNDPPGYLFPRPYAYRMGPVGRFLWRRYYREAASLASFNTFPCMRLAAHMQRHLRVFDERNVRVIPHLLVERLQPTSAPGGEKLRFCHAGNLSAERFPRPFLSALKCLVSDDEMAGKIQFDVIGVEDVSLRETINELGLGGVVRFRGAMDYWSTLGELASSTALVLIEAPCDEGVFLPSKLADYVQVRRPVLAVSPRQGTVRDLISQYGGGVVVDCTRPDDILAGMREIVRAWKRGILSTYLSEEMYRQFSATTVLDTYQGLLTQLAHVSRGH